MKRVLFVIFIIFVLGIAFLNFRLKDKKEKILLNPLVSVAIPAYNHEKFVQETLESIVNQTYQNLELIIIDDGSSDKTFDVIKETVKKHIDRFVHTDISTQKNAGTATTLNRLIERAHGDFIYLIASDDIAYPQAIEKEVDFLSYHPDFVLVVGDNRFIDDQSEPVVLDWSLNKLSDSNGLSVKTFAEYLSIKDNQLRKGLYAEGLFGNYMELLEHGNHVPNGYLIRAQALKNVKLSHQTPLEDYFIMLQLSKLGKFEYIDEILFSYRRHSTNVSSQQEKMARMTKQTLDYENWLCVHTPINASYFFEVNLHKLLCKIKYAKNYLMGDE